MDKQDELLRALKEERAAEADAAKEYDERAGNVFDALWAALLDEARMARENGFAAADRTLRAVEAEIASLGAKGALDMARRAALAQEVSFPILAHRKAARCGRPPPRFRARAWRFPAP
jgi:hypothetical protein